MSQLKQSHLRIRWAEEKLTELKALIGKIREGVFDVGWLHDENAPQHILDEFLGKVWSADDVFLLISEIVQHL